MTSRAESKRRLQEGEQHQDGVDDIPGWQRGKHSSDDQEKRHEATKPCREQFWSLVDRFVTDCQGSDDPSAKYIEEAIPPPAKAPQEKIDGEKGRNSPIGRNQIR